MTFEQFRKSYGGHGPTRDPQPGEQISRGFTMQNARDIRAALELTFLEIMEARDGELRRCWASEDELAIVTFCEGDVTIQVFDTQVRFDHGYRDAVANYRTDKAG